MSEFKLEFVDKVIDSVHGFIPLTRVEKEICNLGIFKRLGKIKQLSFASWVFPGAEHTRFTHSLGVMHIIDKMAVKLKYSDEDRQILRISALLHDIGHFPLSHDGEMTYRSLEYTKISDFSIAKEKETVKEKIDGLCEKAENYQIYHMTPSNSRFNHEQVTKKIILCNKSIATVIKNSNCANFVNLEDICAIITGDVEYQDYRIADMVQLLHSELDADRIDYMMRDGFFSGTSYGDFGVGLLIDNLTKIEVNGKKIIGIKQRGIASGDQFLMNRLLSYEQVMYNTRVSSLAFVAREIMRYGVLHNYIDSNEEVFKNIEDNSVDYLLFTDISFWNCVEKINNEHVNGKKVDKTILTYVENLINNNELTRVSKNDVVLKVTPKYFKDYIKDTNVYKNLDVDNNVLPIFLMCDITKHIPIKMFEKSIKHLDKIEREKLKLHRLMDGIAVVGSDGSVKLLVDENRSLMSTLYNTKLYLVSEFEV